MYAQLIYAFIWNEKVMNITVCEDYHSANELARICYNADAFAVQCNQTPCQIGDIYRDGAFYRIRDNEEVLIPDLPTEASEIQSMKYDNEAMSSEITDLQLALVDQYEQNEALQSELTETQLALVEIYEGMEALLNG